jgi:hypothetical protein
MMDASSAFMTSEIIELLTSSYSTSEHSMATVSRIHEISQVVSGFTPQGFAHCISPFVIDTLPPCDFSLVDMHLELCLQKGTLLDSRGSLASFWMQSKVLTMRSFTNMSRDVGYYWLRLAIYIIVALSVGSLYYRVGTGYSSILVSPYDHPS